MEDLFRIRYDRGKFHADSLFRWLYKHGDAAVSNCRNFKTNHKLAEAIEEDWLFDFPEVTKEMFDGNTRKFQLRVSDGLETESVVIPMENHRTICLSSQIGCARGCTFCETGAVGFERSLKTHEIVVQLLTAIHQLGEDNIRNIVYMGMGEPFDNLDAVMKSIDIVSDSRGLNISKKYISLSTSGHVDGLKSFKERIESNPLKNYHTLRLAVSLNSADDKLRSKLMPINNKWPLAELKKALLDLPQATIKDGLYFEYVIIPGINNSIEDADKLLEFMDGLVAKVNLIPYHPGRHTAPYIAAHESDCDPFRLRIMAANRECRTRKSHGDDIMGACGQLGRSYRAARLT